jgi:hypothetical protein
MGEKMDIKFKEVKANLGVLEESTARFEAAKAKVAKLEGSLDSLCSLNLT